jgi:hypothetical protein
MFKPFKPPLLSKIGQPRTINTKEPDFEAENQPPPSKKRRLSIHRVPDSPPKTLPTSTAAASSSRKPLLAVNNPVKSNGPLSAHSNSPEGYYMVLW